LAELKHAQESANQAIQAMLAKATELQRAAGEHLSEETENAAKLRTAMFAQAERIKVDASADAEQIIDRARHQAAAIDDRARQEFALRRRQMRDEQDLLNRRKHAMLNQLTSLSALAAQTAENLPDVPDAEFADVAGFGAHMGLAGQDAEMESDPTLGDAGNNAEEKSGHDTATSDSAQPADEEGPQPHAETEDAEPSAEHEVGELSSEDRSEAKERSPDGSEYARTSKPSAA
jgi:hypothetical protein